MTRRDAWDGLAWTGVLWVLAGLLAFITGCATGGIANRDTGTAREWDSPVRGKGEWNDVGQAPTSVRDSESPIAGPYYVLISYGRYCQVTSDVYYRAQVGDLVRCAWRVMR